MSMDCGLRRGVEGMTIMMGEMRGLVSGAGATHSAKLMTCSLNGPLLEPFRVDS